MGKKIDEAEKEKRIRYLQENFFVMRFMWKLLKDEVGDAIYSEQGFNIKRNRYERILDGESSNIGENIIRSRAEHFGISDEIYRGTKLLLPDLKDKKDFFEYFKLRKEYSECRADLNVSKKELGHAKSKYESALELARSQGVTEDKKKELEELRSKNKQASDDYDETKKAFDEKQKKYNDSNNHKDRKVPKHEQCIIGEWNKIKGDIEKRNLKSNYANKDFFKLCYVLKWGVRPATVNANEEVLGRIYALNMVIVPETLETCSVDELANISLSIKEIASKAETIYQYSKLKRKK